MQNKNLTLLEIYQEFSKTGEGTGDKGTDHSYIENYYEPTFKDIRFQNLNILEIGVSSGLSLEMWAEYFPNSIITGIELEKNSYQPSTERINLVIGDATSAVTYKNLKFFDIIIDDGSHFFQDQIFSYAILFHKLKLGGIYIIEDVREIEKYAKFYKKLHENVMIYDFRKIKDRHDDVIVEIRKNIK